MENLHNVKTAHIRDCIRTDISDADFLATFLLLATVI